MPLDLIGMRFRGINPHAVVKAAIRLKQAGIEPEPDKNSKQPQPEKHNGDDEEMLELLRLEEAYQNAPPLQRLELHHLAGANPDLLVNGLIEAKNRNIELSFNEASLIDLGGGNVLRVVAALDEAGKRNTMLSVQKATEIELALSKKATGERH